MRPLRLTAGPCMPTASTPGPLMPVGRTSTGPLSTGRRGRGACRLGSAVTVALPPRVVRARLCPTRRRRGPPRGGGSPDESVGAARRASRVALVSLRSARPRRGMPTAASMMDERRRAQHRHAVVAEWQHRLSSNSSGGYEPDIYTYGDVHTSLLVDVLEGTAHVRLRRPSYRDSSMYACLCTDGGPRGTHVVCNIYRVLIGM